MKEAIHLAAKALVKSTGIDNPYPFQIENAESKVQLIIDVLAENGFDLVEKTETETETETNEDE